MRVLTICDRINWGGASKIAMELHNEINRKPNWHSTYLYGYDKKGLPGKHNDTRLKTAAFLLGPHINFLFYHLIGKNIFPSVKSRLEKLIKDHDIVHLHNIHDYGFNYQQLIDLINLNNKPTIVTTHDSWVLTGRCSITAECNLWQSGCLKCAYMKNYHPAIFDFAKSERINKITAFESISNLVFVSPSNWLAENIRRVYPNRRVLEISNGVDQQVFFYNKNFQLFSNDKINFLFIVNDFKNNPKVDTPFLISIIKSNYNVHLVGSNSPFTGDNVINYGFLDKKKLSELMSRCDIMIFLSRIDNQPVAVLEALCTGLNIAAYKDKAIDGLNLKFGYLELTDILALQNILKNPTTIDKIKNTEERETRSNHYKKLYGQQNMLFSYFNLYNQIGS